MENRFNSADFVNDRLLGFVWVGFASVDLELAELGTSEAGLGDHSPNGALDHKNRAAITELLSCFNDFATYVSRETGINFIGLLGAAEDNLISVDHDYEITGINVGGESGLLLAAKQTCGFYSYLAENFALGVDHIPFAINLVWLGGKCLHYVYRESFGTIARAHLPEGARKLGSRSGAVNREIFEKFKKH